MKGKGSDGLSEEILPSCRIPVDVGIGCGSKCWRKGVHRRLQSAAAAAVLAGALALGLYGGDQGLAASEAELIAGLNMAVQDQQRPVLIGAGDITFPEDKKITVTTHRTVATNDPVTLHFMNVLDQTIGKQGEITARASAAVYPVSGANCLDFESLVIAASFPIL